MPVPVNWDTFTWDATTTTAGPTIDTLTTATTAGLTIDTLKATDGRNWTNWIRAGEITADMVRTVDDHTVIRYAPGYAPINNMIWDDWGNGSINGSISFRPQRYEDEEDDICVDEKSWDGFINSDYE